MEKNEKLYECSRCGSYHSEEHIKKAIDALPNDEQMYDLADFFKILGDSTRIRILVALDKEALCVCEIAGILSMTDSAVSHQLKILRQSNLIKSERQGKNIYYSLADSHVRDIIEKAIEHLEE